MRRARTLAWSIAAFALLMLIAGSVWSPGSVPGPWLAVSAAWIGWPLGSMALILIHALTGGRWGDLLRPALRAGVAILPLGVAVLAVLLPGARTLYPWLQPGAAAGLSNGFYLNAPFAALRVAIYVMTWGMLGVLCLRERGLSHIAPAGLIALALTFSFAATDLTQSLDPHFVSSAYGLIAIAGAILMAFALALLLSGLQASPQDLRDFSRLLLGLTVLWAYLDFMQFLIVWQSNLPAEAAWYGPRLRGSWGLIAITIALLHFVLPFGMLVLSTLQSRRPVILAIAALLVTMEIVRNCWLVLPTWPSVSWGVTALVLVVFGSGSAALAMRSLSSGGAYG
ncbi:hypothetical protein [Acetobacter fallax]|uniref:Quinol:cytochrome c oxidoreductase quinone-binding subunit 2 n=1 Tax=Acetobacter fallax TaxID=1737473 RepID=A0ABX0KD32_9PROT|nr:hypothetical protein [Acetobacter fallax]NHO33905.1 hypothetical protein [Acetobacter fallax]NHO37456.1 hypothetical protein [Acetobacter fallax]